MMHSRSLVLFLLFLPGGARRNIRIGESHQAAQQQSNTLTDRLAVLGESGEALIPGGYGTDPLRRGAARAPKALHGGSKGDGRRGGNLEAHLTASKLSHVSTGFDIDSDSGCCCGPDCGCKQGSGCCCEGARGALEAKCHTRTITPTERMRMRAGGGREATLVDKVRNIALAGMVTAGLVSTPVAANAVDVKLGSDSGQLVFVPDEVTIKAGESVTWIGNKGLPHNVVFDEDNVPEGTNLDAINHEEQLGEEGQKVTSKFEKPGTYGYYCEPHRGAGMNGVVIVK